MREYASKRITSAFPDFAGPDILAATFGILAIERQIIQVDRSRKCSVAFILGYWSNCRLS